MTDQADNTHTPAPAAEPLALRLSEGLGAWLPIATVPMPRDSGSYLVADAVRGLVAPHIRGVIHNNPGSVWDWQYGEAITHWMPLPAPPVSA